MSPRRGPWRWLALLTFLWAPPLFSQEPPSFPSTTEQVLVDLVVLDGDGHPVGGLAREDFTLWEDGQPQRIVSFEAVQGGAPPAGMEAPAPAAASTFALVVDDLHLRPPEAEAVRALLGEFVVEQLRPSDEVLLATTADGHAGVVPSREELVAHLNRIEGRDDAEQRCAISPAEALRIHVDRDPHMTDAVRFRLMDCGDILVPRVSISPDPPGQSLVEAWAAQRYVEVRARLQTTLGVVRAVLEMLMRRHGRKTVLLASGGFVHDRSLPEIEQALTAARHANACVYLLNPRGAAGIVLQKAETGRKPIPEHLHVSAVMASFAPLGAVSLAVSTGGFVVAGARSSDSLRRVAEESRTYYLLGYAPDHPPDGRFHTITLRVGGERRTVRARPGYFSAEQPNPSLAVPLKARPSPATGGPYAALVDRYRCGEHQAAIDDLRAWSPERLRTAAGPLPQEAWVVAALLHTELALEETPDAPRRLHLDLARALIERLPDAAERRGAQQRWLLLVGRYHANRHEWRQAETLLGEAVKQVARGSAEEAAARLALGALHETWAAPTWPGRRAVPPRHDGPRLDAPAELVGTQPWNRQGVPGGQGASGGLRLAVPTGGGERLALRRAELNYRSALSADPSLAEAHLRLGRVLARLDRPEDASVELQWALEHATDPGLLYLARLFLGDVHESSGAQTLAVEDYRAALEWQPDGHTAHVALAAALRAGGDREGALAVMRQLFARRALHTSDPWWAYHLHQSADWRLLLEHWRRELRP